jgi:hypothetical protein
MGRGTIGPAGLNLRRLAGVRSDRLSRNIPSFRCERNYQPSAALDFTFLLERDTYYKFAWYLKHEHLVFRNNKGPFGCVARRSRKIRAAIISSGLLLALGGLVALTSQLFIYHIARIANVVGVAVAVVGALIALVIFGLQQSKEQVKQERKIEAVEKRVQENPRETQVAWELARVKLESYLNRNLSQVRSIFFLTVIVMAGGFTLIGVGAYQGFRDPDHFKASVLSSISGVVVSFIGGTFLVLYKSTMAQAKDYVTILERINAVGMSVQILETLTTADSRLKNETTAEIAKQLLHMYSSGIPSGRGSPTKREAAEAHI